MLSLVLIRRITGSTKHGLIMGSVIGFIFLDLVYAASIINYVIQSELNVYLLKAISRLADNKMYGNLDEVYKVHGDIFALNTGCFNYYLDHMIYHMMYHMMHHMMQDISNAECNLRVLNGKTATGASLVIFKLSISAVVGE